MNNLIKIRYRTKVYSKIASLSWEWDYLGNLHDDFVFLLKKDCKIKGFCLILSKFGVGFIESYKLRC